MGITWRSVPVALLLAVVIGSLAPVNDWLLGNTYFYGQHMPVLVTLVILALALLNPLAGSLRFSRRECVLIVAAVLVLGGSVSTGLTRLLPAIIGAPAYQIPENRSDYQSLKAEGVGPDAADLFIGLEDDGTVTGLEPVGEDRFEYNPPAQQRAVVNEFFLGASGEQRVGHRATVTWAGPDGEQRTAIAYSDGEPGAEPGRLDLDAGVGAALAGAGVGASVEHQSGIYTVVAVEPGGVPWEPWIAAFTAWIPMLACLLFTSIAICGVVRHQWIHNERLPYPIAQVWGDMLERCDRDRVRKPSPMFLAAFFVPVVVLGSQGLEAWGYTPLSIPTTFATGGVFGSQDWFWEVRIFFAICAIGFLLPAQTSLSLWLVPVMMKTVVGISKSQGLPIEGGHMGPVSMGGFVVLGAMIVWIGRLHYLRLLRVALTGMGRDTDPVIRAGAGYARLLLGSGVALVVILASLGAPIGWSILLVLITWLLLLVIGRLVAESGLPLVNIPMLPNQFLVSIFGTGMGAAALLPLCLPWMITDAREHLVPFYVNADRLADDRTARSWGWPSVLALCVVIGGVVSGGVMLWLGYHHGGMQGLDGFWSATSGTALKPMAQAAGEVEHTVGADQYVAYASGGIITGLLAMARFTWAWWPLHPIGVVVGGSYAAGTVWTSFMLGWLLKLMVDRYGGFRLYRDLRPAVLGLIAGEAVIAALFAGINFVVELSGGQAPDLPRFLPI